MTPELLPCPFCGEDGASFGTKTGVANHRAVDVYFVNCPHCLASTNALLPEVMPFSKDEAATAWNQRAG